MLDKNLIVIDLETTGSNPETCSIIQIGAVKVSKKFEMMDTFNTYILPYTSVWEEKAAGIHGITKEFLNNNANYIQDGLFYFKEWIKETWNLDNIYLAMWSNGWDKEVLQYAHKYLNIGYAFNYCSYDIASFVRLYLASKSDLYKKSSLHKCAERLGINISEFKPHNVLDDAMVAGYILINVSTIIQSSILKS